MSVIDAAVAQASPKPRWVVLVAATIWLLTVAMALALLWVSLATDFLEQNGPSVGTTSPEFLLLLRAGMVAFSAVVVGYASAGALLAGRVGAGRIAALLLAGGFLFGLVPFGYVIGGSQALANPGSALANAIFLLGPVAIGPGFATILPGLAIAFPDGHLPSPRWRWPVGVTVSFITLGTLLNLVRPGPVAGGTAGQSFNPFGVEALPVALVTVGDLAVPAGIVAITVLGVAAVIVRYRRGDAVERQQQRWFLAAVSLTALPLALTLLPGTGGPAAGLVAALGLLLVPIAVGVAVTRYRLYEIDHLINRTLVYVPLTALLAGLYAATVALLQRVFQSVTGDKSDAAIIISTLILASVFTPVRKWLEGIVDRRFKTATSGIPAAATSAGIVAGPELEAQIAAIALRVVRTELDTRAVREPPVA